MHINQMLFFVAFVKMVPIQRLDIFLKVTMERLWQLVIINFFYCT